MGLVKDVIELGFSKYDLSRVLSVGFDSCLGSEKPPVNRQFSGDEIEVVIRAKVSLRVNVEVRHAKQTFLVLAEPRCGRHNIVAEVKISDSIGPAVICVDTAEDRIGHAL